MRLIVGIPSFIWKLYVGLVFSITAILMFPLILSFLRTEKGRKRSHHLFVFWSRAFRCLTFYFIKVTGPKELPQSPFIVLSNHSSHLDIFLMHSLFPGHPIIFLGKSEILRYPIVGRYFRNLNIPVFRENRIKAARSLIRTKEMMKQGWNVVIFPEGGIPNHVHPQLGPFKSGAFQLAKDMEVPIVCLTFTNNHKLFADLVDLLGSAHPGVARIVRHPVITADQVRQLSTKELMEKCHELINGPIRSLRK